MASKPSTDIEQGGGVESDAGGERSHESSRSSHELGTQMVEKKRKSSVSECSIEVDLEGGNRQTKVHLDIIGRDCRICHMGLDASNLESGIPIELGCCCKDDLAAAHKHCADAWFKIKGNKICEICGSIASNVVGPLDTESVEQWNESNDPSATPPPPPLSMHQAETRNFWRGHKFLNFLLACMVFALFISWLFHFNIPSG